MIYSGVDVVMGTYGQRFKSSTPHGDDINGM